MRTRACLLAVSYVAAAAPVAADFKFEGYGDVRLVLPSNNDETWLEGGLSKTRFGRADDDAVIRIGEIVGEAIWQATPDVMAFASVRYDDDQRSPLDLLEAYVRYRPVSTTAWRWSVKAGAFFPPISLENNEVGWTSRWTLTPSAINTWVGEELRTLGVEAKLELRGTDHTFETNIAVFGWNDPAGILLDLRGWALHDRPTGLFDDVRLPDVLGGMYGNPPAPLFTPMFHEIDDRAGYYARLAWRQDGVGRIEVLRYDNRANPAARDGQVAWRTAFWSAGASAELDAVELLLQGIVGETEVAPTAAFNRVVEFWSAYLLAGWTNDDWRLAARAELFGTDATRNVYATNAHENLPDFGGYGHAFTLSAAWLPADWVRLSGEILYIDSHRPLRLDAGLSARSRETQTQLAARFYF